MAIGLGQSNKAHSSGTPLSTGAVTTQATGSTFFLITCSDIGTLGTPTDFYGNTYSPINAQFALNWGGAIRAWYCENAAGGANHTFTSSVTSTTNHEIFFLEITGGATSGILDKTTAWISDASSPYTTNTTGTTSQANELAIVFESLDSTGATSITWGNSYAIVPNTEETNVSNITGGMGYKVLSATGTEQGSITATNTVNGNGIVLTFKELITGAANQLFYYKA